ncbi:hypothetical protein [Solidesulfovibrio sp.]|uniref:hypothetical protein n=1 Tax=Solidesulfovibrio sp. TaxID=2910990 RepID=UPI0026030733|nr:hypothetical protein [Solidesulfovibrio sp.]
MAFALKQPAPLAAQPEFDCIFCNVEALRSSEAARSGEAVTLEVFCRRCGARKTVTVKPSADGTCWETA